MSAVCPACGGPPAPWRSVPGGEPDDDHGYQLLRCARCGTAVTAGEPPSEEGYESGIYSPRAPRAAPLVSAAQALTAGQPVRLLRRAGLARGARVLDAGAGTGRLVSALEAAGYEASGIEPSARGIERAAEAGLPVSRESIERHEDSGLDAVVLWHVLEHLDEPGSALARLRSWLRPGGLLLIGVPNVASLQAQIAGDRWFHFDAPRHRTHFTPAGLGALLERSGFEVATARHLIWEHNPSGMWMALLSRLGMTPGFPFHLLKRNVEPRARDLALLALGIPLLPIALALEARAAGARRGGTIAVVARGGE